jgi:hypothetical protein
VWVRHRHRKISYLFLDEKKLYYDNWGKKERKAKVPLLLKLDSSRRPRRRASVGISLLATRETVVVLLSSLLAKHSKALKGGEGK